MTKSRECKDCRLEGRTGKILNAPHPGPRCHRHHYRWLKAQSESRANKRRTRIYGLSQEAYEALLEAQGGVCYICLRPPGAKRLQTDHDHSCCPGDTSCGKCVRGLLCRRDNQWLHHVGDDPVLAHRAYEYLTNPPARIALKV